MNREYVWLENKFVEADKATIPLRTHGFLYGTTVFEGIRAYYNEKEKQMYAFRMKEHYERLKNSAKIMHMDSDWTIEEYCQITKNLLKKNAYKQNAYIRPTIYKSAQKVGTSLIDNPNSFMIYTLAFGDYIDTQKGLSVCVSSWRRVSDNAIPPKAKISGSYANAALIATDAKLAGFDDAIALTEEGYVTEGSAMNLFLIENGKLITPCENDNILIGITRNTVIQIAKDLDIETVERRIDRTELYTAQGAFYCGTGCQISPIVKIDNRVLGDGKVNNIAKDIQKYYYDVVFGRVEKYKKWCTPIYD